MKIVVNKCYGGYGLSQDAIVRYAELKGIKLYSYYEDKYGTGKDSRLSSINWRNYLVPKEEYDKQYAEDEKIRDYGKSNDMCFDRYDIERTDPILVQVVEEMGKKANGDFAKLEIVDIPDDIKWEISDYDGIETVEEKHRSW